MEKRLYRNANGKMIGGVCSGLADYFSIDPVLIRLVFVILVLHSGIGVLAYIILWIVVPRRAETLSAGTSAGAVEFEQSDESYDPTDGASASTAPKTKSDSRRGTFIGGIVLIVLGALFLLDNFIPHFGFDDFWPLVLIAIGAGMLWNTAPRSRNSSDEVTS
jgi:phage shock protein C